jgi:DNA-directed RNA polymerase specialized sigma24 family protein
MSQPQSNGAVGGETTPLDTSIVGSAPDSLSLGTLTERNMDKLNAMAYSIVFDTTVGEPEDMLQLALMSAQVSQATWETDLHFRRWMRNAITRKMIDQHRLRNGRKVCDDDEDAEVTSDAYEVEITSSKAPSGWARKPINYIPIHTDEERGLDSSKSDEMLFASGAYCDPVHPTDSALLMDVLAAVSKKDMQWGDVLTQRFLFDRTLPEIAEHLNIPYQRTYYVNKMAMAFVRANILTPSEAKAELDSRLLTTA